MIDIGGTLGHIRSARLEGKEANTLNCYGRALIASTIVSNLVCAVHTKISDTAGATGSRQGGASTSASHLHLRRAVKPLFGYSLDPGSD